MVHYIPKWLLNFYKIHPKRCIIIRSNMYNVNIDHIQKQDKKKENRSIFIINQLHVTTDELNAVLISAVVVIMSKYVTTVLLTICNVILLICHVICPRCMFYFFSIIFFLFPLSKPRQHYIRFNACLLAEKITTENREKHTHTKYLYLLPPHFLVDHHFRMLMLSPREEPRVRWKIYHSLTCSRSESKKKKKKKNKKLHESLKYYWICPFFFFSS